MPVVRQPQHYPQLLLLRAITGPVAQQTLNLLRAQPYLRQLPRLQRFKKETLTQLPLTRMRLRVLYIVAVKKGGLDLLAMPKSAMLRRFSWTFTWTNDPCAGKSKRCWRSFQHSSCTHSLLHSLTLSV